MTPEYHSHLVGHYTHRAFSVIESRSKNTEVHSQRVERCSDGVFDDSVGSLPRSDGRPCYGSGI